MATNNPSSKPDTKEELVQHAVTQCFREHAEQVFLGQVTTGQVVTAVHNQFLLDGIRWSPRMEGHVYDAIYDLGPAGEPGRDNGEATQWLRVFGGLASKRLKGVDA